MGREIKLSATRINMFLQCKYKYWLNYHEDIPKTTNPAFKLGIVCHETLEFAGKIWMEKEEFTSKDKEKIFDFYNKASVQQGLDDLGLHKLGINLVKNRLNNFMIGTKIISLEKKFGMFGEEDVITKDGVLLIGAIDKISEINEDTLLIVDYKTSSTAPTRDQMRDDIQLSLYDLVASMKWPEYERIILCLDLLKSEPLFTYRTAEEREEFSDYLKVLHDGMAKLKKSDAKPSLNIFCPWCDYRDYCKTYKKAYEKENYTFEAAERYNDSDLMSEWEKARNTKKILETRERELAMLIIEKIRRKGIGINNGAKELYIRQNSRITYDLKTAHKLVPQRAFLKMVKLNKREVDNYINNKATPAVRDEIREKAQMNYTSAFLASRKLKKGE